MKKAVIIIGAIVLIIAAMIGVAALMHHCGVKDPEFKIFGSLDELSCFDGYETSEIPDRQELTEGLTIEQRKCFKVDFKGSEYKVCGYVFSSQAEAALFSQRYEKTDRSNRASYVIDKGNRALLFEGSAIRGKEFKSYLFEHLTETIEVFYPEQ